MNICKDCTHCYGEYTGTSCIIECEPNDNNTCENFELDSVLIKIKMETEVQILEYKLELAIQFIEDFSRYLGKDGEKILRKLKE